MKAINRQDVLSTIREKLSNDLKAINADIEDLQAANADNSKSTAGDKHDTERAMLHVELSRLSARAQELKRTVLNLDHLSQTTFQGDTVSYGSLVSTDREVFLIGVVFSKVQFKDSNLYGLSIQSPLAAALMGKHIGSTIELNGTRYEIKSIL